MRKIFIFLIIIFLFLQSTPYALAIYDPTTVSNNRFGIHILDATETSDAANLVNSGGGDWGYITFVIQKTERDTTRWQKLFDDARRKHLIPIVRIATRPQGDIWEKPNPDEIDGWVSFLNSLNWVVKNRYVVISNEPNHAKEWGGSISPEEYATYFVNFSQKLKSASGDFFILPAGLDASAPNSYQTMDEVLYLQRIIQKQPDFFNFLDGWISHSYPNPNFAGPQNGIGRGSVRTYQWEIATLKTLGLKKDLPVFITETGWIHNINDDTKAQEIGNKLTYAFENVWSDPQVIAVTPFVLNYTDPPFDIFSWKKKDIKLGDTPFYSFYYAVRNILKTVGNPVQINNANIITGLIPPIIASGRDFYGILLIRNTGQSILTKDNINIATESKFNIAIDKIVPEKIEPFQSGVVFLTGEIPSQAGSYSGNIGLSKQNQLFTNQIDFQTSSLDLSEKFQTILTDFKKLLFR